MIVEPGFWRHWKVLELIRITGDPGAPCLVLRLWCHCQENRVWRFKNLPDTALAHICGWQRPGNELRAVLIECRLLDEDGEYLIVHDWDKHNRQLVTCWVNGSKGGRYCRKTTKPKRQSGSSNATSVPSSLSNLSNQSPPNGTGTSQVKITPELIYQAYPKKEGRDDALKAISKRIAEGKPPDFLLARVQAYAKAILWKERRFIPHPATWFNQGRFDDDENEWRDPSKPKPPPKVRELAF